MGVQDERHVADGVLHALDQVLSLVGAHGAGHVLEADGVKAHFLEKLAHLDILPHRMDRALGVADAAGCDGALGGVLFRGLEGGFDVAEVVEGVKDADDVDAVFDAQLDKLLHHVVVVVLVAQQVLAAQKHLQAGVRHVFADVPQTLPGVFSQIAQAGVEGGSAPALHAVIAGLVHLGQNAGVVGVGQAGGHEGLVRVAKNCLRKSHFHGWLSSFLRKNRNTLAYGLYCIPSRRKSKGGKRKNRRQS